MEQTASQSTIGGITNTTREAVQQDLKRWDQAGLRQVGAGDGGAPYFHSVRQGFAAYQGSNS